MQAVRIFIWVALVLLFLHSFGSGIMRWLDGSHFLVKTLFCIALVVIVEFGLWASAAGPSDLIKRLREKPQDTFQEIKASFLKLSVIHLLLIVFIISAFLTR